ncbi:hypothetical protein AA11826_1156 [Komagataeibacter oboediens DSM 11826]|uniref:DUF1376 domain-containing protein n=1 Tax=Komagataeibacter oboediens TaxID=65958 RepID=A0A318QST1_9PROT|nr:DUF1376 domain-containing protein [Komagataeibacter oboediens]PYD78199.1 hypothetical protein CFR80_16880 [Komagataeibacter oboediens]GBR33985.1 hypothetical protein AA11826_1156 [Komagataeibacter oboediens DSM 11826]
MTDLPDPLTPEYCDLRGYDFMPLFGHRLFSSEFYTEASDAEFRAGMRLWWAAWSQLPAGSLPNSDRALATLADFGRDVEAWQAVKERALHGFILCSDGRLYHPMLCQEALDAYEERLRKSKKRVKDKERLQAWREMRRKQNADTHHPEEQISEETEVKRVSSEFQEHIRNAGVAGNARGDRDRDSKDTLTSFVTPPSPPSREVVPAMSDLPTAENVVPLPPDARTVLFRQGLDVLVRMTGKPPNAARKLLGKWLKAAKDNAQLLSAILFECSQARPADAIPWIEGAIKNRTGSKLDAMARDWRLDEIDLDAAAEADCKRLGI